MTARQNAIFSSMVMRFTTSWLSSIQGFTMPVPRGEKDSNGFTKSAVVRQTSSSAIFGYSGTFTIEGNGCRFQSVSTL